MFVSKRSLRLGDLAAGTLVVFDRVVSIDELATSEGVDPIPAEARSMERIDLPLERLSEGDIEIAVDYLARRRELKNARQLLSADLLTHLYSRMEVELEPSIPYKEAVIRLGRIVEGRRARVSANHVVMWSTALCG